MFGIFENRPENIYFLMDTDIEKCLSSVITVPTDWFVADDAISDRLMSLWNTRAAKNINSKRMMNLEIPSDVLFTGIPINDIIIEMRDYKNHPDKPAIKSARICVNKYKLNRAINECIDCDEPSSNPIMIGMIQMNYEFIKLFIPFGIVPTDADKLWFDYYVGFTSSSSKKERDFYRKHSKEIFTNPDLFWHHVGAYMALWYGLQISILHPVIKTVIIKDSDLKEKMERAIADAENGVIPPAPKEIKHEKRTTIKYVRKHVIHVHDIDECLDELFKKYNALKKAGKVRVYHRHTGCWYVTGHVRNQKTKKGHKKMFVDGYWKGPLRRTKMMEPRIRKLVLDENDA